MRLPAPLLSGRLIKRYKRFLADVELPDGSVVTAHCADPGRLPGLAVEGAPVWLSTSDDPKRKLAHRLELIEQAGTLVGLNTNNANKLAREAMTGLLNTTLGSPVEIRPEVKIKEGSRIDFVLQDSAGIETYVEVKNITWRDGDKLAFPDAVTARGTKHLQLLAEFAGQGRKSVLIFVAQRPDAVDLRIADEIDCAYAQAFDQALAAGVQVLGIGCKVDHENIDPTHRLHLDPR